MDSLSMQKHDPHNKPKKEKKITLLFRTPQHCLLWACRLGCFWKTSSLAEASQGRKPTQPSLRNVVPESLPDEIDHLYEIRITSQPLYSFLPFLSCLAYHPSTLLSHLLSQTSFLAFFLLIRRVRILRLACSAAFSPLRIEGPRVATHTEACSLRRLRC